MSEETRTIDYNKARAAIRQVHKGLEALAQVFDSESPPGWMPYPPLTLDMMLILNARLKAIQEMLGEALHERPLPIPDFQCDERLYLTSIEGGLLAVLLPQSPDFSSVFKAVLEELRQSSHDYEIWCIEDTDAQGTDILGSSTRRADAFFGRETITSDPEE